MSNFLNIEVADDEKIVWEGKKSLKSMPIRLLLLFTYITGGLTSLRETGLWQGFFGLLFFVAIILIPYFMHKYLITNKRIISRTGFIGRTLSDAPREMITDTHIKQGFYARLVNIGKLYINTAGTSGIEIVFDGIDDPTEVRNIIQESIRVSKTNKRLRERIENLEDRYLTGEITEEQYKKAKNQLENRMKRK